MFLMGYMVLSSSISLCSGVAVSACGVGWRVSVRR